MASGAEAISVTEHIPVVDLAPFKAGTRAGKDQVAKDIRTAAEDIGFLYIKNHGVPQAAIDAAFAASRRFFALPEADKLAIKINKWHRGYMPFNNAVVAEGLKPNLSESFLIGGYLPPDDPDVLADVPMHGPNQWPAPMPEIRPVLESYIEHLTDLGFLVLRAFAVALELPEHFFEEHYRKPMRFIRLLHYPPQLGQRADNEFGAAPHSDFGCVTILAQDEAGGLQVRRRGGGWIDAPSIPGTFVVNIGDMLMRWTNDKWVSTPHRVINTSGRERHSLPFFFDPTYHTLVSCIESCRRPGKPAKYEPITWGDYLKQRFDSIYAYRKPKEAPPTA
jgi:isopenicillin N synthase-like dioxygenase